MLKAKVIKMDVTHPFYVKCHINVHLDSSFLFIRTNVKNNSFSLGLPFGHMTIENRFHCHINNDWKFLVAKLVVTKIIQLPFLESLNLFDRHLCNN
jgi:hypothetical protein